MKPTFADEDLPRVDSVDFPPKILGQPTQGYLAGLRHLLSAYDYAFYGDSEIWQFSVELGELRLTGMTVSDLRWLVFSGHLATCEELTSFDDAERTFRPIRGLIVLPSSAFALTPEGAQMARAVLQADSLAVEPCGASGVVAKDNASNALIALRRIPTWDARRRVLEVDDQVIKSFRVPAIHQELILSAFEEEGWPRCIFDPLPRNRGVAAERRLSNAISRLNGKQVTSLIRFSANGNGTGIAWRWVVA